MTFWKFWAVKCSLEIIQTKRDLKIPSDSVEVKGSLIPIKGVFDSGFCSPTSNDLEFCSKFSLADA